MDLQGPLSPSAKNHIKPETNGKIGKHAPGAHQDQALRNAEQDMIEEIARGPLSPDPRKDAYEEEYALSDQDEPTDGINGLRDEQLGGYENHMDDDVGEGDIDDLDDDMLDKISSSPSIDDGGWISLFAFFNKHPPESRVFLESWDKTLDTVMVQPHLDSALF